MIFDKLKSPRVKAGASLNFLVAFTIWIMTDTKIQSLVYPLHNSESREDYSLLTSYCDRFVKILIANLIGAAELPFSANCEN